ncbi:helix-turn-helix domain-containing protein [Streptomyces sp. NPDC087440]|uniref:helix-turn-helix domain-containing protein n=1 Tax=Streptomyces sp. NPDC087440 TaxID=3365790 RepID=UPI0038302A24
MAERLAEAAEADVVASGPTARRRSLGFRLLGLREAAGLSAQQAGELAGMSKATVSRYERSTMNVRWNQVDQLCRVYKASDDEREDLVELAKASKITKAWWMPLAGSLSSPLLMLLALEDEATAISGHAVGIVPGLLQTRQYAEAIKTPPPGTSLPAERDVYFNMRMKRQEILDRPAAPRYHVVLHEAVLRSRAGGAEVMVAQMDRLLERSRQPHVTIQVIPFAAGAYSAATSNYTILGGHDPDLDVVYVENPAGSLLLEEASARETYATSFDFLCREALDAASSVDLIAEARETHRRNT